MWVFFRTGSLQMWTCVILTHRGSQAGWGLLYCPGGNASASVWSHLPLWGPALGSPSASSTCPWPLTRAARWPAHTNTHTHKMPWREAYSDLHGVASSLDACFLLWEQTANLSRYIPALSTVVMWFMKPIPSWSEIYALKILADFLVICSKSKSKLCLTSWRCLMQSLANQKL